ncbi:hypothetical protein D1007_03185 [Hordeum vulgare]|nr:hypothetical protein D1007_03185 [Hordeum vulgare]
MSGSLASPAPEQAAAATSTATSAQPPTSATSLAAPALRITDEASGRVLPCIALQEGAADPLAGFVDLTSGRVLPCVALMAMEESPVAAPSAGASSRRVPPPHSGTDLPGSSKPRLRSIIVAPEKPLTDGQARADAPSRPGHCGSPATPGHATAWKLVQSRRGRQLATRQEDPSPPLSKDHARFALSPVEAFKTRFGNRCFRCLASRHRSFQCRDPQICYTCKRTGHLERQCPARRPKGSAPLLPPATPASPSRPQEPTPPPQPGGSLGSPSYAGVVASADSHSVPEAKMAGGNIPGAAHRKPATSTCSVVSTPEMEDEAYRLRTTALLLTAVGPCSGITADMVAEAVELG